MKNNLKLLPKTKTSSLKIAERQSEVQEGVKLAKTVDALREAKSREEANLAKFRTESLKEIQNQINDKIVEIKKLEQELEIKKEERVKLEAPIDLTTEWKRVEIAKKEVEILKQELFDRETSLITREVAVHTLDSRKVELDKRDEQSEAYLTECRNTYEKTEELRRAMEERKLTSDSIINSLEATLKDREQALIGREYKIVQDQEKISFDRKDILDKGTNLIQREAVVESKTKALIERESKVIELENLTKRYNDEAERNYQISENLKAEIEKAKDESDVIISSRYVELSTKEQELGYKMRDFILQQETLEGEKKELEKEKIHVSSQQATLRTAWENMRKINK